MPKVSLLLAACACVRAWPSYSCASSNSAPTFMTCTPIDIASFLLFEWCCLWAKAGLISWLSALSFSLSLPSSHSSHFQPSQFVCESGCKRISLARVRTYIRLASFYYYKCCSSFFVCNPREERATSSGLRKRKKKKEIRPL